MSGRHYKLTYFNSQGRGETTRLLLHAAAVKFEDIRIDHTQWSKLKSSTPIGKLPVLEVDGVQLCQSGAINRYVARKLGMAGSNPLENAQIDMWYEEIEDLFSNFINVFNEQNESRRDELVELAKDILTICLAKFEARLSQQNFIVGKKVSLADVKLMACLSNPVVKGTVDQEALRNFPKVLALMKRLRAIPGIKSYLQERPQTES